MSTRMLQLKRYAGEPDSTTRLQREPKFVKYFLVCSECGEVRECDEVMDVRYTVCNPCNYFKKEIAK